MPLKDTFRAFNRKLRNQPIYDKAYRKLHAAVKGTKAPPFALYYHEHYDTQQVVPGRILLDSFWGRMIGCNPYALYLEMRADTRCAGFTYIWVCNDDSVIPDGLRDDPAVQFVEYQSLPYQDALLSAQYLIGNCNFPPHFVKKVEQIYVNVWHGTPIKRIGLDADETFTPSANTQRNYLSSDCILAYSPVMTQRAVVAYGASVALDKVYEIGTPRIDLTLSASRDDVRALLKAAPGRDVLLYAPTWRGSFSKKNIDLNTQLNAITHIQETFSHTHDVFISVHHIMAQALKDSEIDFKIVPSNLPINVVLAGVDILVSDYSSIMVDYMSLDRPIALYCPDYDTYGATQGLHDDLFDLPVAFSNTRDELETAVRLARKPSDFESFAKYKSLLAPFEDGAAAQRGLDIIFNQIPATAYPKDDRQQILLYAGGLMPNGITSSIIALSNAIDHTKYAITIVFDAASMDKDSNRLVSLRKLAPQCQFITRTGTTTYTKAESEAYARFRQMGKYQELDDKDLIDAAFSREARRIFGDQSYDVVIDFSGYGPFWALIFSHVPAGKRLIYQHNDMKLEAYNPNSARSFPELPAVFSLYERYDGIVSVTQEMLPVNRDNLAEYYADGTEFYAAQNVISGDVITQRSNVPLPLVSPQVAAVAQLDELYLFCCVARLSPEKNHKRLLDAFTQVLKVTPHCALLILGTGKLEDMLKKHARSLGISDRVLFLGHCDNPYAIMKACDCKVLASHYEGQGIVLLEALTLGLKCIATDNPAIRNVLQNGVGTIVPQSTDALAKAMVSAAQEGHVTNPPFDAAGYAKSALYQFYASLESSTNIADDKTTIVANRTDGLGERLNAMLNGLWLSEIFGCGFKFSWSNRFVGDTDHAIDTPESTFSTAFLDAHHVPQADVSGVRELSGKGWSVSDLRERLEKTGMVAAPRVALSDFMEAESDLTDRQGLRRAFQRIEFSPDVKMAIQLAEICDIPDNAVALHLRSGDVFFGNYRKYLHYTYKGVTLPLAKQVIGHFKKLGQPVYIFGQDKESISYLCEVTGAHDANLFNVDALKSMNRVQAALYDLVLLSRFSQIVGGSSGFSKQASWVGASPFNIAHKMFSAKSQTAYAIEDLKANAKTYHPLQSGIGYWYAYFYGRGSRSLADSISLLKNACHWDPENELYVFVLAALHVQNGFPQEADQVLQTLFENRRETGRTAEIFRVFTAKTIGTYNLSEYFPDIERAADTSFWAASLMLKKMLTDGDTSQIEIWREKCETLGLSHQQSFTDIMALMRS